MKVARTYCQSTWFLNLSWTKFVLAPSFKLFYEFYSLLYYLLQKRRDVQNRRRHLDTTNSSTNHGHHHASDFIYASPYELIEKHHNQTSEDINNNNPSEIYIPGSVSIRLTPPPLPQRNNNYTPMPSPTNFGMSQTNVMPNSRASSATTPPISRAFPKCHHR